MASREANDAKREEMKALMAQVEKLMPRKAVAALMACTAGNISSWALGKNMGTNAQRHALKVLADGGPERAKLEVEQRAAVLRVRLENIPANKAKDLLAAEARLAAAIAPGQLEARAAEYLSWDWVQKEGLAADAPKYAAETVAANVAWARQQLAAVPAAWARREKEARADLKALEATLAGWQKGAAA